MNAIRIPTVVAVLALSASPALAGKMILRAAAGQSITEFGHGSALEAGVLGQVTPWLAIGVETGVCYLRTRPSLYAYPAGSAPTSVGAVLAGYTDGITRNRAYFLGPEIRVGQDLYGVVSAGIYDVGGDDRSPSRVLAGSSVGIGLTGGGRVQPVAEIRYRHVGHQSESGGFSPAYGPSPSGSSGGSSGSSTTFTFGVSFH